MTRHNYQARREAVGRWPALAAFLSSTVHGGDDRSVESDIERAIGSFDLHGREAIAQEWWEWNANEGWNDDIRFAVEALDSNILFGDAQHARDFMNDVYDRLVVSVWREAGKNWKP